ncbi:MAG: glycosyltransferase family 2 protein [Phycisphaerae bacterium]
MKLSIVIPAYNEEEAIASTIERCLAARASICQRGGIDAVEITVVSDGSVDRTVELARGYADQIRVIEFEQNRGYGAAIKRGFAESSGDIVGFLDADGTCDPVFFGDLCHALQDEHASVAIGSRMGPSSKMPRVRRLGNTIYALILSSLSNQRVSDTASGMRVIRRDALTSLYPLPDGLHFTPAMSARILVDPALSIVERPMAYEERIGESKLSVLRDGVRFLRTIFEMTLMWRPTRLFQPASVVCLLLMALLAMHPLESWWWQGQFDESNIYRLLSCLLLGTVGMTFLSATVVTENLDRLIQPDRKRPGFFESLRDRAFTFTGFAAATVMAMPVLVWLVGWGMYTRFAYGYVDIHWSRIVLAALVVFSLIQMLATILVTHIIRFHAARRQSLGLVTVNRSSREVAPPAVTRSPTAVSPSLAESTVS